MKIGRLITLFMIVVIGTFSFSLSAANWNNNQKVAVDTSISMRLFCETTDYGQSKYPLDWSKSWIPENYSAIIKNGAIVGSRGENGRVLRATKERIEFIFDEDADTRHDGGYVKGTYFRTNGKITARVEFRGGYKASGPIWGQCNEEYLSETESLNTPTINIEQTKKNEKSSEKNLSLDEAKKECSSIGYKPKTEKYADCVMKLVD